MDLDIYAEEVTDHHTTNRRTDRIKVTPLNLMDLAPAVPTNDIPTPLLTPLEPPSSLSRNN